MAHPSAFFSPFTAAFVHTYEALRVYVYDHRSYPPQALNPLARAILCGDPAYREGLHLFTQTSDPDDADLFLLPCDLNYFEGRENQVLQLLTHFADRAHQHVFFDDRDTPQIFPSGGSMCLKTSVHTGDVCDSVVCIPYLDAVDNFFPYFQEPLTPRYPASFVGAVSPLRIRLALDLVKELPDMYLALRGGCFHDSLGAAPGPAADRRPRFHVAEEERLAWRREYLAAARNSRFILAPMGFALNSYRFFEALSIGVPPILVSDRCALPYPDLIDYDEICLRFEADTPSLPQAIRIAMEQTSEPARKRMAWCGRLCYDSLFSARNFLFLLHRTLRLRLAAVSAGSS